MPGPSQPRHPLPSPRPRPHLGSAPCTPTPGDPSLPPCLLPGRRPGIRRSSPRPRGFKQSLRPRRCPRFPDGPRARAVDSARLQEPPGCVAQVSTATPGDSGLGFWPRTLAESLWTGPRLTSQTPARLSRPPLLTARSPSLSHAAATAPRLAFTPSCCVGRDPGTGPPTQAAPSPAHPAGPLSCSQQGPPPPPQLSQAAAASLPACLPGHLAHQASWPLSWVLPLGQRPPLTGRVLEPSTGAG